MKTWIATNVKPIALLVAALLLLAGPAAHAELKNFSFQGTVREIEDDSFELDGSITNGSHFEGFYIFDAGVTNSNSDPTVGNYEFTNSSCGIVVKLGNYVFRTNPRHVDFLIELVNRPGDDDQVIRSYNNICSQPIFIEDLALQFVDPTGTALDDVALPMVPLNLAAFGDPSYGLTVESVRGVIIRGTVNSLTNVPAVIPQPPSTTIGPAVEVKWPSEIGYFYQIQSSEDMITWANVGQPIMGDGTNLSQFFPQSHGRRVFYRAQIANFGP
jgi:hypothetical protein